MTVITFHKPPTALPLLLKAALPSFPLLGQLPGIKHSRGDLPDLELRQIGITTDQAHLDAYSEICGFAPSDTLPVTYPHNSVHLLLMALLTQTSFPFAPMGAVHLRNSITQHRPIGRTEVYDLSLRAARLLPHPKGKLVEIRSALTVGNELVWEESMTLFFRGRGGAAEETVPPLEGVEVPDGATQWKLDAGLGRRFARISGDYNPIHLHPLTAKPFGFARNIAHGMWSKARSLGALQKQLPKSFRVDIEFNKPLLLPATVAFGNVVDANGVLTFGVKGTTKPVPHLVGRITPLA